MSAAATIPAPPAAVAAPPRTGHVGINVTDVERSVAFYRDAFGFAVQHESREPGRRFAFLGDGERLVLTLWEQSEGRFDARRPGLHHLSFQVEGPAALAEAEARLRALGAALLHDGIVPHSENGASAAVFFTDPDGTRLEIYSPTGAPATAAPTPGAPTCGFF